VARDTFENWIPDEVGGQAIQAVNQTSAVMQLARPEPMTSDTKHVPRDGGFTVGGVAKGGTYSESESTNDYVELIARKAGGALRVAEEDLNDPSVDVLATKRVAAARELAKFFDNACLATSGAANGTTILYTSVYRAVRNTNAATSYTADEHYLATGGAPNFDDFNDFLGLYEDSEYFDEANTIVIASPSWKKYLRGTRDDDGMPIFRNDNPKQPTLFDYPITWSRGARVSATNAQAPTGNPLLIIGNRDLLIRGPRQLAPQIPAGEPGFALQRAQTGIGFLTDEAVMKAAMRSGFAVGHEKAFAVLEYTAAVS
jgi:HK97 family phage major capsid protein